MTEWPETIWILTDNCNIAGDFGTQTPGWPNTVSEWVSFCLPDKQHRKEWYTTSYKLCHWEADNYQLFNDLLGVTSRFEKWNELQRARYNITFATLGYTEGQSQQIIDISNLFKSSASFQKCSFVLYDYGTYYAMVDINAQTKTNSGKTTIPRKAVYKK